MHATAQTQSAHSSSNTAAASQVAVEARTMKAIQQDEYGAPEGLEQREIPRPEISDDQVLVRVEVAAIHRGDILMVRGTPLPARAGSGLFKPNYGVPGFDFSGVIEAVGKDVEGYAVGDAVFGECNGSCAEYASADPKRIAHKPAELSFEQAAAIPTSALAALHAMRDTAKVEPGQKVLINGAAGGVGHYAVQIAKALGAEVTGVCSTASVDMVRSLGADHVIDYTQEDFTAGDERYDVIFDNVENHSLAEIRRALTPKGMAVLNSGTGATGLAMYVRLLKPMLVSPFVGQKLVRYLSMPSTEDIEYLGQLATSGKLRAVIERSYPLRETPAALAHIEAGHVHGKLVIDV